MLISYQYEECEPQRVFKVGKSSKLNAGSLERSWVEELAQSNICRINKLNVQVYLNQTRQVHGDIYKQQSFGLFFNGHSGSPFGVQLHVKLNICPNNLPTSWLLQSYSHALFSSVICDYGVLFSVVDSMVKYWYLLRFHQHGSPPCVLVSCKWMPENGIWIIANKW